MEKQTFIAYSYSSDHVYVVEAESESNARNRLKKITPYATGMEILSLNKIKSKYLDGNGVYEVV